MKKLLMTIPCILLLGACLETTGSSTLETGTGFDTAQSDQSRGSIARGASGKYIFSLSRDAGACTTVFDAPASAGKTDLSTLRCTDGSTGTATVVYGADATPDRVVYAVNGSGGGTIRF